MRHRWTLKAAVVALAVAGSAAAQGLSDIRTGTDAFREGDFRTAVEAFTAAITSGELSDEALAITYNNRGVANGELGAYDQAIADYTRSLELKPEDETTRRNLRVAHLRRGQERLGEGAYEAALADFDRAIELDPDHHLAYQRRAELHAERGDLALALNDYERAAILAPEDEAIRQALEETRQAMAQIGFEEGGESTVGEEPDVSEAAGPSADEPMTSASQRAEETPASSAAAPDTGVESAAPPATTEAEPGEAPTVEVTRTSPEVEPRREEPTADANGQRYRAVSAVNFRAGPANEAERLGSIDAGAVVEVVGKEVGWLEVIVPTGERGYIYQSWLEPVEE